MSSPLTASAVLFQDDFSTNGPLNSANWDFNHWTQNNNSSFLGQTQMRQNLPSAENGMARIKMDTYTPPPPDNPNAPSNSYYGSEAITNQAWDLTGGGLAFEGKFKFEGNQGGMIAGFFSYEKFAPGVGHEMHDEIDFEIITTQMQKISTNIFKHQASGTPESKPVDGGLAIDHVYRFEWLPSVVRWYVDGKLIRETTENVPTKPQQLHINLWGAPQAGGPNGGPWGPNPGDPGGPNITDPTLLIAHTPAENKSYYFDVDYVKVERLATHLGDSGHNNLLGSAASEALDGAAGDDTLDGGEGHDTVAGGAGNDTLKGGVGDDSLYGGTGTNILSGGAGADRFHSGDGADTVRDTLADLHGDTFAAFGANDAVHIQGALVGRGDVVVTPGAGGTGGSSVTIGGTTFQMEGDQSGGDFMTVARGTGPDANTLLTFQNFLPTLAEGARVDSAKINGIANEPFLTGDGAVGYTAELKSAASAYANTLGYYKIAADGTIGDVNILFNNTMNVASGARTVDLGTPADGERVAFFLIQNGFSKFGALPDNLSFVTPGTGTPSDVDLGVPPVLSSATLGLLNGATIFHSLSTLNPNDALQVLSGTSAGGKELLIGFEDLPAATGDNDFQDIVISIKTNTDDFLLAA
ncbi:family 16 glycosylhydrolase [Reyranella sp.]|uniref:family 16 glycosylhydrolase n=1 Tax=Reyranella sp. TaxID=1929291 RepID=UPI001203F3EA|nr:family 16 glycosylhydrolase [Reyranella sp.]TAJ84665.1 MAG: glycosyl hydrolase family protein [Reyranella sp.]